MAESVILIAGHIGAGKTTGIQSVSEIEVVSTEAKNHDKSTDNKATTTVALDFGTITLGNDMVKIYGLPGQKRFNFMWAALKKRASCLLLLTNNAHNVDNPIVAAIDFLSEFPELRAKGAVCVGITHFDLKQSPTRNEYDQALKTAFPDDPTPPIFTIDPRKAGDMQMALLATLANTETNFALSNIKE